MATMSVVTRMMQGDVQMILRAAQTTRDDAQMTERVKRSATSTVGVLTTTFANDRNQLVERLYLATLSRRPTAEEKRIAVEYLNGGPLVERAEDLQFVLINSLEFSFV